MSLSQRAGLLGASTLIAVTALASFIAPYDPGRQFSDRPFSPPMLPHLVDDQGHLRAPFVYPMRLVDPLERRYEADRRQPMTLRWLHGRLAGVDGPIRGSCSAATASGATSCRDSRWAPGCLSGSRRRPHRSPSSSASSSAPPPVRRAGPIDDGLMRLADVVIVLPGIYVILALRGALPLVLSTRQVFLALVGVLGLVGWPAVARGVRGIFVTERTQEYAEAARALGASRLRLAVVHLLPAARGFLLLQTTVLIPAFIVAEATISFAGLGFPPPTPSWGAMLQDAASARVAADAPWLLSPAAAIALTVLTLHTAAHGRGLVPWLDDPDKQL